MCYFMLIVFLIMFAFGIAMQALTFHNPPLSYYLILNTFYQTYFVIGGQYSETTLMGYMNNNQPGNLCLLFFYELKKNNISNKNN